MMRSHILLRMSVIILVIIGPLLCVYVFGRSLWHPVLVKFTGETTVQQRVDQIVMKKPYLAQVNVHRLTVLCFKKERCVDVYCDEVWYKTFPIFAASGKAGPKMKEGDGQVPEGFYSFDAINPNSSYYLSLRISYPNKEDARRSAAAGISDFGSDIYMHGKSASIGCIAVGDENIEEIFCLAAKAGLEHSTVIIAPCDFRRVKDYPDGTNAELYRRIAQALTPYLQDPH